MASLPALIIAGSVKARLSMNMDIVKPIPPSIPRARICIHRVPSGFPARPSLTASQLKTKIPRGLPSSSPKKTPGITAGIVP